MLYSLPKQELLTNYKDLYLICIHEPYLSPAAMGLAQTISPPHIFDCGGAGSSFLATDRKTSTSLGSN